MMKKILLSIIIFTQSLFGDEVKNADESNLVKVPLLEVISDAQKLFTFSSDLKVYQGGNPVDVKSLNFLFGEINTSDAGRLSISYQDKIDQIKRNGGIPKAQYYDRYNLRSSDPSKLQISFKMNEVDGWGFGKSQSINEIFLLKRNLEKASHFLRISPKKNEAWHAARLSRVYPDSKDVEPLITKIDESTWVHAFRMVYPSNEGGLMKVRVGKIYFEKYGRSIEIFTGSEVGLDKWFDFVTRFGENILEQIEQIGIYPDRNSVELVSEKRMELFGSSGTPSFVLDAVVKPTASSQIDTPKFPNGNEGGDTENIIPNKKKEFAEKVKNKYEEESPSRLLWIVAGVLLLGIFVFILKALKIKRPVP
jgi:hypothetical protein